MVGTAGCTDVTGHDDLVIIRLVARVNEDTDPAEADRQMLLAINELHREGDLDNEDSDPSRVN